MKKKRGPYRKVPLPSLSFEKLEELHTAFERTNRHFNCPKCNNLSFFIKNGYSTQDTTQPNFICKSCKKYSTAYEIYNILCSKDVSHNENSNTLLETSTNTQMQMEFTDPRDLQIQQLLQQIQHLEIQLQETQKTLTFLKQKYLEHFPIYSSTTEIINNNITTDTTSIEINTSDAILTSQPPTNTVPNQNSTDTLLTPWNNPTKVAALKQKLFINRQKNLKRKEEAASRFFQPPSQNQGFKYLYISTKARIPVGRIRTFLRQLGVNNSRVLDIHYPDRNIVAILVHNDFVTELRNLLESKRICFNDAFNPWSSSILKDPQFNTLFEQEKTLKAAEIQQQRLERAINRLREPVKYSVAYYFFNQKWLSKKFLDGVNESRYGNRPLNPFTVDPPSPMDIISTAA